MTRTPSTRPIRPWRRSLRRALGAERNELARPEDRARSRAGLLATVATGLALVLGATAAWTDFDTAEHRVAAASSRLHHVDALLLSATTATADRTATAAARYQATATWAYPAGQRRTGTVDLSHQARAGSTVGVWADDTGRLTTAPPSTADLVSDAVSTGLLAVALLFVLTAGGVGLRLRSLDRRTDTAWQRAWEELEPAWTGRAARRPGTDGPRRS
ncbi:Rv1733c family protein [Kitasatospora aureofaciens]|uniref:Rv1733c family protein n=1 Tax=Kitasatospora aureofaciens TaxID=1894 RepID=UPI0037C512E0